MSCLLLLHTLVVLLLWLLLLRLLLLGEQLVRCRLLGKQLLLLLLFLFWPLFLSIALLLLPLLRKISEMDDVINPLWKRCLPPDIGCRRRGARWRGWRQRRGGRRETSRPDSSPPWTSPPFPSPVEDDRQCHQTNLAPGRWGSRRGRWWWSAVASCRRRSRCRWRQGRGTWWWSWGGIHIHMRKEGRRTSWGSSQQRRRSPGQPPQHQKGTQSLPPTPTPKTQADPSIRLKSHLWILQWFTSDWMSDLVLIGFPEGFVDMYLFWIVFTFLSSDRHCHEKEDGRRGSFIRYKAFHFSHMIL